MTESKTFGRKQGRFPRPSRLRLYDTVKKFRLKLHGMTDAVDCLEPIFWAFGKCFPLNFSDLAYWELSLSKFLWDLSFGILFWEGKMFRSAPLGCLNWKKLTPSWEPTVRQCMIIEILRLSFFVIFGEPQTSRSHVTRALPSGLRFEVHVCTAKTTLQR